jgi:hypothetical protein
MRESSEELNRIQEQVAARRKMLESGKIRLIKERRDIASSEKNESSQVTQK